MSFESPLEPGSAGPEPDPESTGPSPSPGFEPGAEAVVPAPEPLPRTIAVRRGAQPGPTVIVVAGIHGNEPAGVRACERVFQELESPRYTVRGILAAFRGNTRALQRGVRYLEDDLNRLWAADTVRMIQDNPHPEFLGPEEQELLDLMRVINEIRGESEGRVHLLDLHTTSAGGAPFATVGDTLRNRKFALRFPVPIILGLEEQIDGPMLEFMGDRGVVTLAFEGGQHEAPASVDNHESLLWIALAASGVVRRREVPDLELHRARLRAAGQGAPRVMEVRHRQAIRPEDGFTMRPGFHNFQPVSRGTVLADDVRGEITACEDGLLLMPLYQGLGEDGFFLGRAVKRSWLRLSTALRRLKVGRLMPFLPGVWRHPEMPETLIVNTRVARFYPLEIFHLLGYRRRRSLGPVLLVSRRRYDD